MPVYICYYCNMGVGLLYVALCSVNTQCQQSLCDINKGHKRGIVTKIITFSELKTEITLLQTQIIRNEMNGVLGHDSAL